MAIYPAGNPGVYPLVPTSDIGKMRLIIGDTESVPYDPVQPGYQNYAAFSDAELQALLDMSGGDFATAVGYAYLKLAGSAAGQSVEWSSDDLRVNLSKTPGELRQIAELWFGRGAAVDFLEIVPTGRRCHCEPELAGRYVCICGF